jgi:hypothetical protein
LIKFINFSVTYILFSQWEKFLHLPCRESKLKKNHK